MQFYAHSANQRGAGRAEPMAEHVGPVANRSGESASIFGAADEAFVTALLHDIGKYTWRFLQRLEDPVSVTGVDHWTLGSLLALKFFRSRGIGMSAAIAGHHVGMSAAELEVELGKVVGGIDAEIETLGENSLKDVTDRLVADGFQLVDFKESIYERLGGDHVAQMLNLRMLFSTLVDADFIETEAHFAGDTVKRRSYREPGDRLDSSNAMTRLTSYIREASAGSSATNEMNRMRASLGDSCGRTGLPKKVYTLTAPTGAGKTLAMIRFALQHAKDRANTNSPIRRIISVLPFLTIIEQTVGDYQKLFGHESSGIQVLEDHSLSEQRTASHSEDDAINEQMSLRRLLAQNWDAPVVVTTNVQFFESLFHNRPSACRKLHNIANSVILLDEVQTLPHELVVPTLAAVAQLVERFGCTVVFATATQPAFEHLGEEIQKQSGVEWNPEELNLEHGAMFQHTSRRTLVAWRLEKETSWTELASEVATGEENHVLVVVNLKRHAIELTKQLADMPGDHLVYHLSTNLCPAHRKKILDLVKEGLQDRNKRIFLIATQCIEAGVDISFEKVFRSLAPLDAIAQAAGRCNRGGEYGEDCEVVVFLPKKAAQERNLYPPGYGDAAATTKAFIKTLSHEEACRAIHSPEKIKDYYRMLYDLTSKALVSETLQEALELRDFASVAKEYKLIANDTIRVLVPYDLATYKTLRAEELRDEGIDSIREWVAAATPNSVSVQRRAAESATGVEPVFFRHSATSDQPDWLVLQNEDKYDATRLGLLGLDGSWIF